MKKITLTLTVIILVLFSTNAIAANWKWVESSDTTGWYIDTSTLKYNWSYNGGNMYISFWLMTKYEDPEYRKRQVERAKKYYPYFDFRGFYYEIGKQEYYYIGKSLKCRFLSTNFYRFDNSLIGSDDSVGGWSDIVPGAVGEMLYYKALGLYRTI